MINLIIKLEANLFYLKSKFIPYIILFFLLSCNSKQYSRLSYLALGDSYTIGESVDSLNRYPNQFVSLLEQRNILVDNPLIIAKTGWTTDELKKEILSYNIKDKFDLVSLLIGVNNQYRGRSSLNFREEFEDLLKMAIQFTKSEKVTVLTIPDWGKTPFARDRNIKSIEDSINVYNSIVKDICKRYNVNVIDIVDITRQVNKRPELLARDSLHPSGLMYKMWAKKMLDEWRI
ncbi:MAG: SGNH/GDSL hydrolase family protein [Flavobacteriaceae bacterium]|jgi:lysophospholipase L1-like esterase